MRYDLKAVGGSWITANGADNLCVMTIGTNYNRWRDIFDVLLHEASELVYYRQNARYEPSGGMTNDHSAYFFAFDHTTFSNVCAICSGFLVEVQSDLHKAWRASRKKPKGKK